MLKKIKIQSRKAKYFASMEKGSTFAPRFDEKNNVKYQQKLYYNVKEM